MTDQPKELFRQAMTRQLPQLLGCESGGLPSIFADPAKVYVFKIGIHQDLMARYPSTDAKKLSRWLGRWVSHGAYLNAVRKGRPRVGLDLEPAGDVTPEAIEIAGRKIKDRYTPQAPPSDDRSAPCTSPEGNVNQTELSAP
jgi:sRNA-binding protein